MLPGGSIAAAFVLSLIPGWLFLRATDRARQPRAQSALQEFLEVVAVGLVTSGASILFWVWLRPGAVFALTRQPTSPGELRSALLTAAVALAFASGLALLAAWLVHRLRRESYSLGVWWEALTKENIPEGHTAHVAIALDNDVTVDGVLHSYTWSDDVTHRDVSLEAPIRFTTPKGEKETPFDRAVIPGNEIRHLSVMYHPKGDAPAEGTRRSMPGQSEQDAEPHTA